MSYDRVVVADYHRRFPHKKRPDVTKRFLRFRQRSPEELRQRGFKRFRIVRGPKVHGLTKDEMKFLREYHGEAVVAFGNGQARVQSLLIRRRRRRSEE